MCDVLVPRILRYKVMQINLETLYLLNDSSDIMTSCWNQ